MLSGTLTQELHWHTNELVIMYIFMHLFNDITNIISGNLF